MEDDEDDGDPDLMPHGLKHDILKTMLDRASEMYVAVTQLESPEGLLTRGKGSYLLH